MKLRLGLGAFYAICPESSRDLHGGGISRKYIKATMIVFIDTLITSENTHRLAWVPYDRGPVSHALRRQPCCSQPNVLCDA